MINHKSAVRTQLQCDAWASLPGLRDNALRSELNYPSDPRSLSSPPAVLPFCTLPNPPILHSMEQHRFLLPCYSTPLTQPLPKCCSFLLCSTLDQEVHFVSGWMEVYYTTQVRSNPYTPACWCIA